MMETARRRNDDAAIEIAPATMDALDTVAAIESAVFADPWARRAFEVALRERHARFRIARVDGCVAGYIIAWIVVDEGEIANLAVAPEWRGRGVAKQLLATIIAEARAEGVVRLYLEVRESNVAAQQLYTSHGFAPLARRSRYYRKPVEDAIVLGLQL
jgi:ribosomal-protein-alanine N-acetyltransferase